MKSNSLSRLLLQKLLPSIGVVLLLGGALGYWVALRSATLAYDRSLLDANLAIAGQISVKDGHLDLHLPEAAQRVLVADNFDTIYYEIIDAEGHSLGGNATLPHSKLLADDVPQFFDGLYNGSPIRLAEMQFSAEGERFLVISAETMVKRDKLVNEILMAMMLPGLILAVACIVVVYRGISKGLAGIPRLRDELSRRSHADLSPLPLDEIPAELAPLFAEANDLLLRLAESIEKQRNFIADASHQLRTPIATLLAEAEQALRAENPRAELKNIVASTQRLSHVAHQLLTLSRFEPGQLSMSVVTDLASLATKSAERWVKLARPRNTDIGFELSPAPVLGDGFWLEELADNLVDNAIRYAPPGGIVTVRCGSYRSSAWLEVEDNGPGIPLQERSKVFERFYRLRATDSEGCGLGLAIVKEIAVAHNAVVLIETGSQHGGALVRISFPAAIESK